MGKRQRRGSGSIRKRGNVWEVRRRIDGQTVPFYGATLAEAQVKAATAKRQTRIVTLTPTVRDYLADWLQRQRDHVRPQTWLAYETHARRHIVPAIGSVRLDALMPEHIDTLHAVLLRTVSGTTAHHVHMTLSAALSDAERRGIPVTRVMTAVSAPRRTGRAVVTLNHDEVDLLLEAARGEPLEALFVLAVTLGIRQGELLGLAWQHVNLPSRRLTIAGTAGRTLDGRHIVSLPKTAAGARTLTLPRIAIDALARTGRTGDLVWPAADGSPMPGSTFYQRHWLPLRERAGIRRVNFHALRHTAATLLLEDGEPAHVVAAMLGHASVATTLRLYAHVTHASTDALADRLDARYGPRLRLVPDPIVDTNVDIASNNPYPATEKACRERESNPYALTSTAP